MIYAIIQNKMIGVFGKKCDFCREKTRTKYTEKSKKCLLQRLNALDLKFKDGKIRYSPKNQYYGVRICSKHEGILGRCDIQGCNGKDEYMYRQNSLPEMLSSLTRVKLNPRDNIITQKDTKFSMFVCDTHRSILLKK